jgi:molybdopterin-biosynthesis enzyme MoeA-like protein
VRALGSAFDVVFTSGGVGPTHDDVTVAAVALAFGVPTVSDPSIAGLLRATYGSQTTEAHLQMALIPEGAWLAFGADNPWPALVMRNVWVLPGIPEVFRSKLDVVRSWLRGPTPFVSRLVCARVEEPFLKPLLDRVVAEHPQVQIGSYPQWTGSPTRTKITFDGRDGARVSAALGAFLELLPPGEVESVE